MQQALDQLKQIFGDAVLETGSLHGNEWARVETSKIVDVVRYLKETPGLQFNMMMDLCGVDYPERTDRFEVVYHLYSLENKKRIRLKVRVPEASPLLPSITSLYKAADWFEREVYDLYGVIFTGHPNMKRILLYPEFEGHPLRKDYPVNKRPTRLPTPDPLIK